jgi:hypothetical protein
METPMPETRVNDPCPCGSGKKYKKCCKGRDDLPITIGVSQDLTKTIELPLKRSYRNFETIVNRAATQVMRQAMMRVEWSDPLTRDADRVQLLITEINNKALRLLKLHSRQYWYFIIRRVPEEFCKDIDILMTVTDLVLTCSPDGEPGEFYKSASLKGINYSDFLDQLPVVIEIIALGYLKYDSRVLYRLACKGIQLYDSANYKPLHARADESINNYELRRSEHETLMGSAGLWIDPINQIPLKPDLSHLWTVDRFPEEIKGGAGKNVLVSHNPARIINPRFVLNRNESLPYDFVLNKFSLPIERMLGVSGTDIATFLYALFQVVFNILHYREARPDGSGSVVMEWDLTTSTEVRKITLSHWADVAEMGLLRADEDSWHVQLYSYAALITNHDSTLAPLDKNKIREITQLFTNDNQISRDPNEPVLFNKLSAETLVLDFLRYLILQVSKYDERHEKQKKGESEIFIGRYFEEEAAGFFIRELCLDPHKVIISKEIAGSKEIDIAFVYEDTLFVFDCKAFRKDAEYIEGQHRKIRNRLDKLRQEFVKCNDRAELIRQGFLKSIISPKDFSKVCMMICTSAVEYLPMDDSLFWYKGAPLVGTPSELIETVRVYA